eukprot:6012506-Lingulodinium_polyedra.AAC.1
MCNAETAHGALERIIVQPLTAATERRVHTQRASPQQTHLSVWRMGVRSNGGVNPWLYGGWPW